MRSMFGSTDTGLVRKANQDRFECVTLSDALAFAVLCDGMGGENGGSVASEIATKCAVDMLRRDLRADMNELSLRSVLMSAVAAANALVFGAAQKDESLKGMGTTMILAVILNETLYAAYVGDSRVYCVSPESEAQLTKDHTIVQMLVDIGEITEQDAKSHPKRHYITRAVGVSDLAEADFVVHALTRDDIVLLCSDGMYNYLAPGMLYRLLETCLRQESAGPLITFANSCGGADNITAVVAGWRN